MRLYACPDCGTLLDFDNLHCSCGAEVAWDQRADAFQRDFAPCANRAQIGCNWAAAAPGALCRSCAMTTVIPDTFRSENRWLWADAERAKRRVLAALGRWGWLDAGDPGPMPEFHLLSERTSTGTVPVSMGHLAGTVTINVTEADPAARVERREALGERFRTMIGHFRHELAHFLFERLSAQPGFNGGFRAVFGDERQDYGAALQRHYDAGPPDSWGADFVTAYASSHPHEDWAECVAHVMHLTDIADSFVAARLSAPGLPAADYDAYAERDPARLLGLGVELGIALNHVNRSMGLPDIYPFVLTPAVRDKLAAVHGWLAPRP